MRKGFTLIELLIAIGIIGILTTLATISYADIRMRGRDSQRKNDLAQLTVTLSTYHTAQSPTIYVVSVDKATLNNSTDPLAVALKPNYIKNIPTDPKNTDPYLYKYQSFNAQKDYKLFATLENTKDTRGWAGGSEWIADGYVIENQ